MSNPINPLIQGNISTGNTSGAQATWSAGQLLHATFLKKNTDGQSLLKVGNTLLQAKLPQSLQSGDKVLLEVIKTDSKLVVRIYSTPNTGTVAQSYILDAIKQNIANQNSATLLLNTIQVIQKQSPIYTQLPISIRRLMKKLLSQAVPLDQIRTANGVKKSFQNSGIFLERRLLESPTLMSINKTSTLQQTLNLDFKATLLKLKQQLTNISRLADNTNPKGNADNYQNLAKVSDGKQPNNKAITGSGTATMQADVPMMSKTGPDPSALLLTNNLKLRGSANFYGNNMQGASIANGIFSLHPLLRNNSPHPAGSNKRFFSIAADKLATNNQGLILQLLKMVESSLSRINIAQLGSTTVDTDNKQVWLFDIPIVKEDKKDHDLIQAKIETDQDPEDNDKTRSWTVQIAMDLDALGPLQTTIKICDNKVQTHFKSSDPEQQKLIEENINILRANLNNAGLLVEKLICTQGLQDTRKPDDRPALVDEEV